MCTTLDVLSILLAHLLSKIAATNTHKRVGCQAGLKKTKIKSDLLTDIDMLLMAEKGIRGGIYHAIQRCTGNTGIS